MQTLHSPEHAGWGLRERSLPDSAAQSPLSELFQPPGAHSHSRMRATSSTMRTETQKMSASRRWLMQGALNIEDPSGRIKAGSGGATASLEHPDRAVPPAPLRPPQHHQPVPAVGAGMHFLPPSLPGGDRARGSPRPERPGVTLGTVVLRVLSQVMQGAGAGPDSGL